MLIGNSPETPDLASGLEGTFAACAHFPEGGPRIERGFVFCLMGSAVSVNYWVSFLQWLLGSLGDRCVVTLSH